MRKLGLGLVGLLAWTAAVAGVTWHMARVDQPTRPAAASTGAGNDLVAIAPPASARNEAPIVIIKPDQPAPKPQPTPLPEPDPALVEPGVEEEFEEEFEAEETPPAPPAPVTPPPASFEPLTVNGGETSTVKAGAGLESVHVAAGGTLNLPAGQVTVRGNLTGEGKVVGGRTSTLILDGNQEIGASLQAGTAILRGGTKRLTSKATSRNSNTHAAPGQANLIIEPGATLIIEEGAAWDSKDAYAYQVGGTLIIDGGTFTCTFANNAVEFNDCWLPGSQLIIRRGKFIGNGDHEFSGASISIFGGSLEINDDIWHSGDSLDIRDGVMRNSTGGGMFYLNGNVRMTGGKLQVNQSYDRGLRFWEDSSVFCTGGEIEIRGTDATGDEAGILLRNAPTLSRVTCTASTRIHGSSQPEGALSIAELVIAKGKTFNAAGFAVSAPHPEGGGQYLP